MAQKVLIVSGSSRQEGNTAVLANAFMEGALTSGNQVYLFNAGNARISGCKGCRYCFANNGECKQVDDMQKAYKHLRMCDVLVLASPVYFFDLSAQMKAFIDRLYCGLSIYSSTENPFTIKSSVLLLVQELLDTAVAENAINIYQRIVDYASWKNRGVLLVPGVSKKGDISGNPILGEANKLGASIV